MEPLSITNSHDDFKEYACASQRVSMYAEIRRPDSLDLSSMDLRPSSLRNL
jgi:hypothetical protein